MTLLEIKTAAASMLDVALADFTINSQDLWLVAANQVRKRAELRFDFEFSRKLVTVAVNGVTGGTLSSAVLYGTATPVDIKTIIDVGLMDDVGNFRPVEWTTVSESMERFRSNNQFSYPRYPTDAQSSASPLGGALFTFAGDSVYRFPVVSDNYTMAMLVYSFTTDWVTGNLSSSFAPWTTRADEYLLWATVLYLNQHFKEFVLREQGNTYPPQKQADEALEAFVDWDVYQFEQARRHNR